MKSYKRVQRHGWRPLILLGVKPHKKTGILWLRLRTPAHLIARRSELEAFGVDFRVEHHRSLETRDPKKAVLAYAEKRREIETLWKGWETLLAHGPRVLSYRNIVALAGERALQFFSEYEDEPFDVPPVPEVDYPPYDEKAYLERVRNLSPEELAEFKADLKRFFAMDAEMQRSHVFVMLNNHPFLREELGPSFATALETLVGGDTEEVLKARGLTVDEATRRSMNLEMAHLLGVARKGLEQRQAGDWGDVKGLHALPIFKAPPESAPVNWRVNGGAEGPSELTFEEVIAEQRRLSDLRLDKQVKAPETLRNYREHCEMFAGWRGSRNILTVSPGEVAKYRDEMIALSDLGKMRRKTIINRVTAIRAVIRWAIAQNKRDRQEGKDVPVIFPGGNPLNGIDLPEKQVVESEERTLTKGQARKLLRASRKETEPILRWGQWLLTYSGMRIGEEVQLEKADVQEYDGFCYLRVRVEDERRTTKTRKSRRVPLHKAIIAEGFLDFVKAAPDGPLFGGSRRQAVKQLRSWVHSILDEDSDEPLDGKPPLHGFRHLFRDIAMGHIEYGARNYIEGRMIEGSGEDYGRSAAMVPKLSRMMDEIEPLIPMPERGGSDGV